MIPFLDLGAAYRELQPAIDAAVAREEYWLRDPRRGVLVERMIWREMDQFSQGAVCMVLASHPYDESDYIRDYGDFLRETGLKEPRST